MKTPTEKHPELARIARDRDTLTTSEAARALNRSPQTLRKWSCWGCGPIKPIHIFGRLAWRVSDVERLLKGGAG